MNAGNPLDSIGRTVGVEEEYHLVGPESFELLNRPELSALASAGQAGPHLQAEMLTSQLESATEVCADLDELRRAVVAMRSEAASAAAGVDAAILAASTHPFSRLSEIEVMQHPRYDRLIERFGSVVQQFNLCGCHVHVSVPDLDTAVAIMTRARPYLPVLAALTASSPFHEGIDTGYASFRLAQLGLWPQGGPPPILGSASDYLAAVEQVRAVGLVDDATMLLWELRPSARYPTLEFRIGDVCTDADDVVLYAGLIRSLVRTLGRGLAANRPWIALPDVALRAARWRAARHGVHDTLWSAQSNALVPAPVAIEQFWAELEPDLVEHGERDLLRHLLDDLLGRGTSATRQRRAFARTGSLLEVTREAVATTVAAC